MSSEHVLTAARPTHLGTDAVSFAQVVSYQPLELMIWVGDQEHTVRQGDTLTLPGGRWLVKRCHVPSMTVEGYGIVAGDDFAEIVFVPQQ